MQRHHRRRAAALVAALAVISLLAASCGNDADPGDEPPVDVGEPGPEQPSESPEQPGEPDPADEDFPTDEAREEARGLLGMNEGDLPDDVRIARRGDEQFMLTQDYVLGRRTVELDGDGSGYRVMTVTVELPDGPETFELQGG